jgi:hypothetical protein
MSARRVLHFNRTKPRTRMVSAGSPWYFDGIDHIQLTRPACVLRSHSNNTIDSYGELNWLLKRLRLSFPVSQSLAWFPWKTDAKARAVLLVIRALTQTWNMKTPTLCVEDRQLMVSSVAFVMLGRDLDARHLSRERLLPKRDPQDDLMESVSRAYGLSFVDIKHSLLEDFIQMENKKLPLENN